MNFFTEDWKSYKVCKVCYKKVESKELSKHEKKCEEEFWKDKKALAQNYK